MTTQGPVSSKSSTLFKFCTCANRKGLATSIWSRTCVERDAWFLARPRRRRQRDGVAASRDCRGSLAGRADSRAVASTASRWSRDDGVAVA